MRGTVRDLLSGNCNFRQKVKTGSCQKQKLKSKKVTLVQVRKSIYISMPHSIPLPRPNPAGPVPSYRLPHLIHTYSHLPTRAISHNDASMTYYSPAPIGCDLTEGFERRIKREDEEEHLDGLVESLEYIIKRGGKGERKEGIITWRGMLTK